MNIWIEPTPHGTSQGKYVICCDKTKFKYERKTIIGRLYQGTLTDEELTILKNKIEEVLTMPEKTAYEIVAIELGKAKGKHPEFPLAPAEALSIITEELGELAEAINDKENKVRQVEEAAHVAVSAIRFIEERLK